MDKPKIKICIGSSCFSRGNDKNVDLLEKFLADRQLKDDVDLELEGCLCMGKCPDGPVISINDKIYTHVSGKMLIALLNELFPAGD